MRFRVRGPTGQSIISLSDDATVRDLNAAITKETSLEAFEIKIGYPPKTLELDQVKPSKRLSDHGVKLHGEQLLIATRGPSEKQVKNEREPTTTSSKSVASNRLQASSPSTKSKPTTSNSVKAPSAAALTLHRKPNAAMEMDPPEIMLPDHGGALVLRIMPDDNSCLFRAITNATMPELDAMNELRSVVAQTIQANPETYSKPVLDNKEPDEYCRWIQTEDAWGGQIELNILSNYFNVEICSIDVQRLRIDRYNEGRPKRCIVVYSGIHYDTIALSPFDSPPESDQKMFDTTDDVVLASALELCQLLKDKGYYTDTAGFKIRCQQCGTVCVGEMGATEHASQTGHYNFGEGT
jgi:ubiquitin thioesterase OTU1